MDEIRALAGPVVQRHFEKVEADRQALQARLDAERAAKKEAEERSRKAFEAAKAQEESSKDEEMTDADAPAKAEVDEAGDP